MTVTWSPAGWECPNCYTWNNVRGNYRTGRFPVRRCRTKGCGTRVELCIRRRRYTVERTAYSIDNEPKLVRKGAKQ